MSRTPRRREHAFLVTVTAPGWATRAQVQKEVRTLINDQANWGSIRGGDGPHSFDTIEEKDIKVRKIGRAP